MVSDLKDFLKERIKNPFLAAFCFFWFAFNWKILAYILFSSDSIELKIDSYQKYYNWQSFYVYPFFTAAFYVVVSTFIFAGIEWLSVNGFLFRRRIFYKKLEGDINAQESVELAKYKREQARSGYEKQKELNDKIEHLSKDLSRQREKLESETSRAELANIQKEEILAKQKNIIKAIESDLQYDLFNKDIRDFVKKYSDEEIERWGVNINTVYLTKAEIPMVRDSVIMQTEEELIKHNLAFIVYDNNHNIIDIALSPVGRYLLKLRLLRPDHLKDINLNYRNKKII